MGSSIVVVIVAVLWVTYLMPLASKAFEHRERARTERDMHDTSLKPYERTVASLLLPEWIFAPWVRGTLAGCAVIGFLAMISTAVLTVLGIVPLYASIIGALVSAGSVTTLRFIAVSRTHREEYIKRAAEESATLFPTTSFVAPRHADIAPTVDEVDVRDATVAPEPAEADTQTTVDVRDEEPARPGTWTPRPVPPPLYTLKRKAPRAQSRTRPAPAAPKTAKADLEGDVKLIKHKSRRMTA